MFPSWLKSLTNFNLVRRAHHGARLLNMSKRYTGSLYKRKDSPYWWGSVMIKGVRFQRPFSTNKAASLEDFRKWRKEKKDSRNTKKWEWFKKWFIENELADDKPKTIQRYQTAFRAADRIIQPKMMWDFTSDALSKYRLQLKEEADAAGYSAQGVNSLLIRLKSALDKAVKADCAYNLKTHVLTQFKVRAKPLKIYELWELGILRRYTKPVYKVQFLLFCRAGLRPEEGRNLLESKINRPDKSGCLYHNDSSAQTQEWDPKKGIIRNFTLEDPYLWAALQELPPSKSPYLLTNRYGEPFSDQGQLNSWKKELKRINAELEEVWKDKKRIKEKEELLKFLPSEYATKPPKLTGNLKNFRKTFATQLEENEHVKVEDIRFLLGHRPKGVTDTHYFVKKFEKKRHIVKYLPEIP